mmetsp:Transcript_132759/g.297031  ORF Transcript_132759/g.297031 Transcript_132759/m.297031 type:complete len:181 (+) Transcript_132759:293-835(+)
MACWELGLQLKRDWLPELQKVDAKLLVVGIGTAESAHEFAKQVGLPAEDLFADEEAMAYKAVRMVNSDFEEDGRQRGMRMLTEKTSEAVKGRANGRPLSFFGLFDIPFLFTNDDLEAAKEIYKPLLPKGDNSLDKTLVQGGVFVFDGDQEVFRHRDTSVAVHADLGRVLQAVATTMHGEA